MTSIHAQNHRDAPFLLRDHLEEPGLEGAGEQRSYLLLLPFRSCQQG